MIKTSALKLVTPHRRVVPRSNDRRLPHRGIPKSCRRCCIAIGRAYRMGASLSDTSHTFRFPQRR